MVSLSEYSVIKREFNGNRSVPSKFMLDIEYSVITSDVIKSFDCTYIIKKVIFSITLFKRSHSYKPLPLFLLSIDIYRIEGESVTY